MLGVQGDSPSLQAAPQSPQASPQQPSRAGVAPGGHAPAGNRDAVFDVNAAEFSNPEFRMFQFKIKRCPRARPHDWTLCPFAHPGEKAKRRDPKKMNYSGTACPDFRKGGICPRGDSCPFAHGVFECWLHPSRYRTQMCTDGVNCKRRVCFFAHFESEVRKAEADPILLSFQLHKELGPDMRAYQQQQQQYAHALGGLLGPHPHHMTPPQSPQYVNSLAAFGGGMQQMPMRGPLAPVMLPGAAGLPGDGSAPCTPTAVSLTPATSQESAVLLAHLQMLQQQQQQQQHAVAAAAAQQQRPASAPLSGGASPAGLEGSMHSGAGGSGGGYMPVRPVSASASGDTLGSSGSPPISPTGVAAGGAEPAGGVPATPSIPDLAQPLKAPLSPLGAALLQQQQVQQQFNGADALALLQAAGMAGTHLDQTSLMVALHSLSLSGGGGLPSPGTLAAQLGSGGGGLIRHASDAWMQSRAAAAAAAAATLSPPGHGLVSHRRSMDNSMLAQLHSLSRSSPLGDPLEAQLGTADLEGCYLQGADLAMEAARLSPLAIRAPQSATDVALETARLSAAMSAAASGVQLSSSLPPPSPTYLVSLAAAVAGPSPGLPPPVSPLSRAAAAVAERQRQLTMSPQQQQQMAQAGLQRIITSATAAQREGAGAAGVSQPPTPQTAPAAMARDAWSHQLCSIDESGPVALSPVAAAAQDDMAGMPKPAATVYKTLSDPSVLIRNLSFENILAELPRSSSQVALAAQQQAAMPGDAASGSSDQHA